MIDAYKQFWTRTLDFSGRSTRPQFWWPYLLNTIISTLLAIIFTTSNTTTDGGTSALAAAIILTLWMLALIIPQIAVGIRRLHDAGMTGWWILAGFIPLVGGIILLILFVLPSNGEGNQWGPVVAD